MLCVPPSLSQIRNYADCACVQSRQVITPSSNGQGNQLQLVIVKTYLNENGYAVSGKCDSTCSTLIPFLILLFIVTLITACAQPSAIIVTLRYRPKESTLAVHSNSIQTHSLFPHFVTLQPYSKIDLNACFSSAIYTQYSIITKRKQVFRNVCKKHTKNRNTLFT